MKSKGFAILRLIVGVFSDVCLPRYPSANAWLFEYWDFSMLTSSSICDTQEHGTTKGVLPVSKILYPPRLPSRASVGGVLCLACYTFPTSFNRFGWLSTCHGPVILNPLEHPEQSPVLGGFKDRFVICTNPDYPFLEEIRLMTKTIEGLKVTFRAFGIDGAKKTPSA